MTKNMGRPVANKYKVPKRAWGRWSNHAKGVFNRVFHTMRNQDLLIHPKSAPMQCSMACGVCGGRLHNGVEMKTPRDREAQVSDCKSLLRRFDSDRGVQP
jgi:hypothetical protein